MARSGTKARDSGNPIPASGEPARRSHGEEQLKLTYFEGSPPNFGDELNPYVWSRVLPAYFLDEDESELFIGIGSTIGDIYPATATKIVAGAGYGGYHPMPNLRDGTWEVLFVRGPRSAELLGLPPDAAICDGALLLRSLDDLPPPSGRTEVAFMPHFESLSWGRWEQACELAGIRLIDARRPVEEVIAAIRGTDKLVTEAMHGAVVADALRVPWIAAWPINPRHRAKWHDWAEALNIDLRPHPLTPSSLLEAYVGATKGRRHYGGRARSWSESPLMAPANNLFAYGAAMALRRLAAEEPQLSNERNVDRATERALDAIKAFVSQRMPALLR